MNFNVDSASSTGSDSQVTARKVGESVSTAIETVASAINYPIGMSPYQFLQSLSNAEIVIFCV